MVLRSLWALKYSVYSLLSKVLFPSKYCFSARLFHYLFLIYPAFTSLYLPLCVFFLRNDLWKYAYLYKLKYYTDVSLYAEQAGTNKAVISERLFRAGATDLSDHEQCFCEVNESCRAGVSLDFLKVLVTHKEYFPLPCLYQSKHISLDEDPETLVTYANIASRYPKPGS